MAAAPNDMVKRFVVRVKPNHQRTGLYSIVGDGPGMLAAVAIIGATSIVLASSWPPLDFKGNDFSQASVSTFFALVAALLWFLHRDHSRLRDAVHESVVAVYPLGIQIENRVTSPAIRSKTKVVGESIFIPMEALIDCVVREVVLSHKVISILQFRVLCRPGSASHLGSSADMKLVQAFPGVELSYSECLTMRAEIHKYLLQEQSNR